jgi:lambda repressor-like predicted transcriptional regulator
MRKLIDIKGKLEEKGSTANRLSVKAALEGKNLKNYIEEILESVAIKGTYLGK